jgi:hypothetical protein
MNYREWITESTERLNVSAAEVELILTNQSELIPDPTADVVVKTAKLALCREIAAVLPLCNVSEGGYSLTWNIDAVKLWYSGMCRELGIADVTQPKVKGRSDLW